MAAAFVASVILIILTLLLSERIEVRIYSEKRLKIQISSTLLTLELYNFNKKKKTKKKSAFSLTASLSSLRFLTSHSGVEVRGLGLSKNASPVTREIYKALFSLLFAYSDSALDKISLPDEADFCESPIEFDILFKARAYIFILSFIIYKFKKQRKAKKKSARQQ